MTEKRGNEAMRTVVKIEEENNKIKKEKVKLHKENK